MAEAERGGDKLDRLRKSGLQVDALNEKLVKQLTTLDDDELRTIAAIKTKLNTGLPDRLKAAADTVGGFVW